LNVVLAAATVNALSEGAHAIGVHARDSLGNWGACAVATLIVDKTGPNTTGVVARPNPNNGTLGVLVGDFLMERIDGTSSDPVAGGVNSNIAAIEGFVDTVGADGSGLVAVATDAHFDSPSEAGYITLPLYTVTAMNEGPHSVYMHGKDAAGNWGPVSSTTLVVDKTGPNVSGLSVTPNPSAGAASVTLSASATDPVVTGTSNASNVVAAEYIFGPDQGAGTGTASPVSTPASTVGLNATVSLAGVPSGSYLISVRAKDAAGNWGPVATRLLQVLPADGLFADSFEAGNLLAWSATAGANLGVTSAAAMNTGSPAGSRGVYGLRAGISSGVSGYVQDNRASPESSYRARFYFNPNGTTSAGHDILVAVNGSTTVFRVQYRTNLGQAQVRAVVTRALGTTATNWFAIGAAGPNAIEVAWQSGTSASFSLYTGGALRQTLTGLNTSALTLRVAAARLGPQNVGSAVSGTEYFDEFVSTRTTPIGP
jgi:hypothetical protein